MLYTVPHFGQMRRPASRCISVSLRTSSSSTASSGWPISSSSAFSEFAWSMLRGKPSRMKPRAASGRLKRSRIRPSTMSSETSWPASITALALRPSSVPRATASRSRSPEDTCGTPYLACRRCACVPLPDPGAPSNTIRISPIRPSPKEAHPTERRGADGRYHCRSAALCAIASRPDLTKDSVRTCPLAASAKPRNAFYAQSGGVTAVINASACGVIETCRKHKNRIGKVYAGRNGIVGALTEDLIDTSKESAAAIRALRHTPAGAFGSARYKLKKFEDNPAQYERLIEVFKAHDIGYFFYNGGGDSADTCLKVSQLADKLGYPIQAIHVPKTVDNDLPITDCCPGFGSVAKYVAVSIREAGFDVASMAKTSTKVFILEVMGRHAGWIAAAGGLAAEKAGDAPHIILFPGNHLRRGEVLRARQGVRGEVRLLRRRRVRRRARTPTASSSPTRACAMRSAMRSSAASRR